MSRDQVVYDLHLAHLKLKYISGLSIVLCWYSVIHVEQLISLL